MADEEEEIWYRVPEGDGEWCVATQDHQLYVSSDVLGDGDGEMIQDFDGAALFDDRAAAEAVCDVSHKHFKMPHRYRFVVVPEVEIRQERLDRGFLRKISHTLHMIDQGREDELDDDDDDDDDDDQFIY